MEQEAQELLRIEGLHIDYERRGGRGTVHAVAGLDIRLAPGEVLAIVGESGSGKSTLACALAGLLAGNARIAAGSIRYAGREVTHATEKTWQGLRGGSIGFVPQDPGLSLDPVKRIGEQIVEAMTVHGIPARQARARVAEILQSVGLADHERVARAYPHELSGGMRQRILIGIALANEPALVIADEPTSALDVTVQRQVLDHLEQLTRRRGIAVLLITHDLGVALDRADRVVVMQQGRIVEAGPVREVFARPGHAYTRKLMAAAPGLNAAPAAASAARRHARLDLAAEPILRVQDLVKDFRRGQRGSGHAAVGGVSFSVPRHGTTAIVGESGSGKSTTARLLLCLDEPSAGSIHFDGRDVTHLKRGALRDFRRRVQVVYQNPYTSLDPRFTIEAIIAEPLRAFGIGDSRTRRARAAELLESVELSATLLQSRPAELSGGQRQRVAIARALAIAPELLVLDEPVSALDVSVQAQVLSLLARLQLELGVSYLFISHDLAVVRQIADFVVVLQAGQVVEQGPAARLFDAPQAAYTRELLNDTPGRRHQKQGEPVPSTLLAA
jgi:peptide/nickel transport system ATP-binding protein